MKYLSLISLFLLTLLLPIITNAQDIVVLDADGLTRINVANTKLISIEIKVQCNPLSLNTFDVILLREDGLGDEIKAFDHGACTFIADNITTGRWRIKASLDTEKLVVDSVTLLN